MGLVCIQNSSLLVYSKSHLLTVSAQQREEPACGWIPPHPGLFRVNMVLTILDNFTLQKTRKYLAETKTLIKIPIVFKNLFESIREKLRVEEKLTCISKK